MAKLATWSPIMYLTIVVAAFAIIFSIIAFGTASGSAAGIFSNPATATSLLGLVAAAFIALGAHLFTNRTKISEFRQEWIDHLREDLAQYIGKCRQWMEVWNEHNLKSTSQEDRAKLHKKAQKLNEEARVYLYKIKLRINPRHSNPTKVEDEEFLKQLDKIIDPMSAQPLILLHHMH